MNEPTLSKVEFRVRPITRYVVTRYEEHDQSASSGERGIYDNPDVAWEVAYALCKAEHELIGWPVGDDRIVYPRHPNEAEAQVAA